MRTYKASQDTMMMRDYDNIKEQQPTSMREREIRSS